MGSVAARSLAAAEGSGWSKMAFVGHGWRLEVVAEAEQLRVPGDAGLHLSLWGTWDCPRLRGSLLAEIVPPLPCTSQESLSCVGHCLSIRLWTVSAHLCHTEELWRLPFQAPWFRSVDSTLPKPPAQCSSMTTTIRPKLRRRDISHWPDTPSLCLTA